MESVDKKILEFQYETFIKGIKENRNFIINCLGMDLPLEDMKTISFTKREDIINDVKSLSAGIEMLEGDLQEIKSLDNTQPMAPDWFRNKEYYIKIVAYKKIIGITDFAVPGNSTIN